MGIGEIYRRLMAKCVMKVSEHLATNACGNFNLCAGLPAGIEGAVHAVRHQWDADKSLTPLHETLLQTQYKADCAAVWPGGPGHPQSRKDNTRGPLGHGAFWSDCSAIG